MAYRNISSETMIMVTAGWVDPNKDRAILENLQLTRPLVPLVDEVHEDLLIKQGIGSMVIEAEIQDIQNQQQELDLVHDRKKRGAYMSLSAFAELSSDPAKAAEFLQLRDFLMPGGRKETLRSYLDEAGDAERLRRRLTPEICQRLASLITPTGTILSHVQSWLDAAERLGNVTRRRMELEREAAQSDGSPSVERDAAFAWIRVIRAVETNLELDPAATPEIKNRILGPLHHAELLADRRVNTRGAQSLPDDNVDDNLDDSGDDFDHDLDADTLQSANNAQPSRHSSAA